MVYDLIVLALLLAGMIFAARKGFVGSLVHVVGFLVALVAAALLSTPLAQWIYNAFIDSPIQGAVTQQLQSGAGADLAQGLENFFNAMPNLLKGALGAANLDWNALEHALQGATEQLPSQVSTLVVMPVVVSLLRMVLFLVIFSVLLFLIRRFVRMAHLIQRIPLVGTLNTILGGALGLLEGLALAVLFYCIVSLLGVLMGSQVSALSADSLADSRFFAWMGTIWKIG